MKNKINNMTFIKFALFSFFICFLTKNIAAQPRDSITNKTWYKKINQVFGVVATGQGDAINLANYGSFDPVNGAYKLNVFGPLTKTDNRKAVFFNINAAGKIIGDNSGVLFNNSKFNSGTAFGGKLHFPITPVPFFSANEIDTISRKIKLLHDDIKIKKKQYAEMYDSSRLAVVNRNEKVKMVNIITQMGMLDDQLTTVKKQLDTVNSLDTANVLILTTSYLDLFKKRQQLYTDSIGLADKIAVSDNLLVDGLTRQNIINGLNYSADTAYANKREGLEMSVGVPGYKMLWFSLVTNVERKKYYTFNDAAPFTNQFAELKFTTSAFGVELNFSQFGGSRKNLFSTTKKSFFILWNIGVVRTLNNNIGDLTTTELTDSRKHVSGDSTHSLGTKYNVYIDPIIEYRAWKLYGNFYRSLGENRNAAVHFFSDVEFRDNNINPFNIGLGFVIAVKNKKDNSLFNIEFFGKLIDVGKALPQDEAKLINRNQIGINFGIPVNLSINNKQ